MSSWSFWWSQQPKSLYITQNCSSRRGRKGGLKSKHCGCGATGVTHSASAHSHRRPGAGSRAMSGGLPEHRGMTAGCGLRGSGQAHFGSPGGLRSDVLTCSGPLPAWTGPEVSLQRPSVRGHAPQQLQEQYGNRDCSQRTRTSASSTRARTSSRGRSPTAAGITWTHRLLDVEVFQGDNKKNETNYRNIYSISNFGWLIKFDCKIKHLKVKYINRHM